MAWRRSSKVTGRSDSTESPEGKRASGRRPKSMTTSIRCRRSEWAPAGASPRGEARSAAPARRRSHRRPPARRARPTAGNAPRSSGMAGAGGWGGWPESGGRAAAGRGAGVCERKGAAVCALGLVSPATSAAAVADDRGEWAGAAVGVVGGRF